MCNKGICIGKYYAKNALIDEKEYNFTCDVYSVENDDTTKFYARLKDGSIFEVTQTANDIFNLQIDLEHQYFLISEESIILEQER